MEKARTVVYGQYCMSSGGQYCVSRGGQYCASSKVVEQGSAVRAWRPHNIED